MLSLVVQPLVPSSRRFHIFRHCLASAVCVLFAGCNSEGANTSGAQTTPLASHQVQVSPEPQAQKVSLASSIHVRFAPNTDIANPTGLLQVLQNGEPVAGQVVFSQHQEQLSFQPLAALQPNTHYQVILAEAVTTGGERIAAQQWTFTTADNLGLTPQWVIDTCMTDDDIALLASINQRRLQGGQCGGQALLPMAPLMWSCDLAFIASEHASDLVRMGLVSSTGSNGLSPVDRVSQSSMVWRGVAENDFAVALDAPIEQAVEQPLGDVTQCQTVLNNQLTHLGAAVAPALDKEHKIWVQLFVQQ